MFSHFSNFQSDNGSQFFRWLCRRDKFQEIRSVLQLAGLLLVPSRFIGIKKNIITESALEQLLGYVSRFQKIALYIFRVGAVGIPVP